MTFFCDAASQVHRQSNEARIVSLVPSITETLFALNLGPRVVGRTRFCTAPADAVASVADVGGTKTINIDRVHALRPTHVIVNVDETPRAVADALKTARIEVIVTHPISISDNRALFHLLGGLFGKETEAGNMCRQFDAAYEALVDASSTWPDRRVLYLIWKKPWMTVSPATYIAEMLKAVKWRVDPAVERYPTTEISDITLAGFDMVLLSTEPFPFTQTDVDAFIEAYPAAAGKARLIDGAMLSWYGSRAIDGLSYLRHFASREAVGKPRHVEP